ncbi:uncharacterized protein LOC115624218 [Scaptodrosophila lebanonensis]|uniref:Uncharacterized protein LOC115624218 n=1 Tax=Drosophila lebanonensis TaxID=7225 RepID=A0A6J2THU3_DROLE|nr:uncharacterized protein LOC115624218 [Scaptodrosophila lebanonensis]XP_030374693.1 uncharacterized protein LOC115624218 [Scaptodrosophila lebanonensis]
MIQNTAFYKTALEAKHPVLPPLDERIPNRIDDLHDIIFENIFESITYLNDQVSMARAYPQFLPLILKIWNRRKHYRVVGPNTAFLGLLDLENYVFFMEHMTERFVELHVHEDGVGSFAEFYNYITHLCDINITLFPNVESCILTGNPETMVDEDIRDLTVILPNLRRLTSGMNLSGLYMRGFRKLEELVFKSVYHSIPLQRSYIQDICLSMTQLRVLDITDSFDSAIVLEDIKLPNLEVLRLNLNSVECMLRQVLQLPKLRKLGIRFDDSRQLNAHQETIFQEIIMAKSERITRIALNNEVVQLPARWHQSLLVELPKLRSLICENWYHDELFLDRKHIPGNQMETLSFSGWEVLRECQLLELIADCPHLKYLHLNGYHSTTTKLHKLVTIREALRNPKTLLVSSDELWTHLTPNEFQYWRTHKYVQVGCDLPESYFQEDGFEFDFE